MWDIIVPGCDETAASILAGDEVTHKPQLHAETCVWGGTCVSVDISLTVFKDQSGKNILFNLQFDSPIDSFQTSNDGSFLFVAVDGPQLHCIHIPSGKTAFSECICLDDDADGKIIKIFCLPFNDQSMHVTIVCSNGQTLRCSNLNLRSISSALASESVDQLTKITSRIIFEPLAKEECNSISAVDLCYKNDTSLIVFGGNGIGIKSDFSTPPELYANFRPLTSISNIQFIKDELFFLALTSDGELLKICSVTLICLQVWKDFVVEDFTTMPCSANSDQEILLITKSENHLNSWLLLMSADTFDVKLRQKIHSQSCLVHLTSKQQEIMYLECSGENFPDTVHLKRLLECLPIDRFNRLLRRNKFEEAQRFAESFNLDTDEVSKGQAKGFVSELCPWSREENASSAELTMSKLIAVLDKIKDTRFVCDLCITAAVPELVHVRKLLSYAKQRLSSVTDGRLAALATRIHAMECRLETCEIIIESSDFDSWVSFLKKNLLQECKELLSVGELHRASIIWTRHLCEIKALLTPRLALSLLQAVPLGTPVRPLTMWLSRFVPVIMDHLPEIFEDMLLWIIYIIKSMASQEDWPESGFQCAQEVLDLLQVGETKELKELNLFHQYSTPDSALQQFIALIKAIKQLKTLHYDYRITKVTVGDLMSDDKSWAVKTILKHVSILRFGQFVSGFLETLVKEWDLDMDTILFEYVESLVCMTSNQEISDYAPWEFPVSTLLSFVTKYEQLLGGILLALKAAPVPWSDTIEKLAERGLKFNHPYAEQIKQQRNIVVFKLVLKKYNVRLSATEDFDHITSLMFIRRIVKRNLEGMLEDCLVLSGEDTMLQVSTYYHVFDQHIADGNVEKALQMLDALEQNTEILQGCCRKIIFKCSALWDHEKDLGKYSEILPAIENRLNRIVRISKIKESSSVYCIRELINLQRLKDKVHIGMRTQDYSSKAHRSAMLQSRIVSCLNIGEETPHCEPQELAILLRLTPEEGILEYMKRASMYGYIEKAVALSLPLASLDTLPLCLERRMISVILQMIEMSKQTDHSSVAQMVMDISTNACMVSTGSELTNWTTFFEWSQMVISLPNSWEKAPIEGTLTAYLRKNWKLSPIFFDRSVVTDTTRVIALVKGIYIHNEEVLTKENVEAVMAKLHAENNNLMGLSIIRSLYQHTSMETELLDDLWCDACYKLFVKVILSRKFDADLGVALLLASPQDMAHSWLKSLCDKYMKDMKRLESLSSLAVVFYKQYGVKNEFDFFSGLHLRCVWSKRFVELGIATKDAFNLDHNPRQVLEMLMHVKHVTFDLIEEFCEAFQIDLTDQMLPFIQIIILGWEPEVKQFQSPEGNSTYTVLNDKTEVLKKCKVIMKKFKPCSKSMVYDLLVTLMNKVNYYFYETYLVLYELMEMVTPKISKPKDRKLALNFLRTYTRMCQPERLEVETWMEAFPDSNGVPLLSKWRLPFHQFLSKDVWSVVKLEVNLNSYKTWLRAAPIIGLDPNSICSVAIRQSIKQVTPVDSFPGEWCLQEQESFLISQIRRCVDQLSDPQSASAALFHVINNTPPGADLYALTKLCYSHACTWRNADKSSLVQKCCEKVERKYLDVSTSHILFSHGLGATHYLKFKSQPHELIVALYKDPSVVARGRKVATYYPNINEAVEKLVVLHELNLRKILFLRLDEYMTPSSAETEWSDDTFTELVLSSTVDNSQDEENHLRACYILQGNVEVANMFLPYLVTIAYKNHAEDWARKLQALKCLYSIANEARLEKLTGRKIASIRKYMQSLHYVVALSRFGILYTVTEFEVCVKLDLVKMIWQLHGQNKSAVQLIIGLCNDFQVFQTEIWDFVLVQLIKCNMDASLEELLPRLAEHSPILGSPGYIQAWNYLLRIPFNRKDVPLTAGQLKVCLGKLGLLEVCPVVSSVDLLGIVDRFIAVGCPHLAAAVLPFMTSDLCDTSVKKLLEESNTAFIIEMLRKPDFDDFLTVQKAMKILKSKELATY